MELNYNYQSLDEETNIPDLKETLKKRDFWGIVDEEQGGIIAYAIGEENADIITAKLNINAELLEALKAIDEILPEMGLADDDKKLQPELYKVEGMIKATIAKAEGKEKTNS